MPADPPPPPPPPATWTRLAVYEREQGLVRFIETRPPPPDIPFAQIQAVHAWVRGKEDELAANREDPAPGILSTFHLDKIVQEETMRTATNLDDAEVVRLLRQLAEQMDNTMDGG